MQIMTFTFHNLRCFVANDICVASEIRALAGTFGSAIRRLILLMMSAPKGRRDPEFVAVEFTDAYNKWLSQEHKKGRCSNTFP